MIQGFLNIELLPWQQDVAMQMLRGGEKLLTPPSGIGASGGRTYMGAVLAFLFVTKNLLLSGPDWQKVIVINPNSQLRVYLNSFINDSPLKEIFIKHRNIIYIRGFEDCKFILFLDLIDSKEIMGFFGNLLFILDGNGRPYPTWAEEIISASISSDNCYVYRT